MGEIDLLVATWCQPILFISILVFYQMIITAQHQPYYLNKIHPPTKQLRKNKNHFIKYKSNCTMIVLV